MARDRNRGVVPEAEMLIMESDVHHLREQADRDRRATAERLIDIRGWRDRVDVQLARQGDSLERLEVARKADAQQLAELVGLSHRARGAFWVLAALAGLGPVVQVARMLLEHLK